METIDRYLLTFLLNSLWQIPLVAAVTALACRLMRNGPARHRHAVCVAGLVAALLLPAASVRGWAPDAPTIAVPQRFDAQGVAPKGTAAMEAAASPAPRSVPLPRAAASIALWAFGLFLLLRAARLAWACAKTMRIYRNATAAGPAACPTWDRCKDAFGLRDVELRWSPGISGPVTAGKVVILPEGMQAASDDVLATAIGHEMAHIARGDFACNVVYELLYLPISFQPAAAWLRREIDRTRELACDELVTGRLLEPRVYAQSIMEIAATMSGLARPGYTLGVFDGDILEERIRRLVERPAASLKRARLLLAAGLASLAVCAIVASTLAISARAQTPAQQEMRLAGEAYNGGNFAIAVEHFEKAVALEPGNLNARLFLATAYLRQYYATGKFDPDETVPVPLVTKAREQYLEVLNRDPKHTAAVFGLVALNGPRRAGESRDLMLKVVTVDPQNKEAYYTVGVLDWQIAYQAVTAVNGRGPAMYRQIGDPALRATTRGQTLPLIEEGFRMLQIALDLDPLWSDAMAYMNLLSRLKMAIVDDPAESARLLTQADEWVGKALTARKARPLSHDNGIERIDVDGPAPKAIAPPPPPPPPPPPGYRGNGDRK